MSIPGEGAGKGDTPRPTDKKAYDETWIRCFGKPCPGEQFLECKNGWVDFTTDGRIGEQRKCKVCNGIGKVDRT